MRSWFPSAPFRPSRPASPPPTSAGSGFSKHPLQPHVALTHSRSYPGFVCHRSPAPPTLLDTVVQSLRCLPELDGLVIAESAVVLKGLPLSGLRGRLDGRNDARERRIVRLSSRSRSRSLSAWHGISCGGPASTSNHRSTSPGMGHLDLMVDGRLGIETDGAGFHMDRPSFEEDRRRWNVTTRLGIPTLVVSYPLLKNRPEEFHRHGP